MRAAPRIERSRSLAVRMVLVAVLTPVMVLGLLIAMIAILPQHQLFALGVMLPVALAVTVYRMLRKAPDGQVLRETDDPDLFAIVNRLCALADLERPELVASEQAQPNSWVVHLPARKPRLYITSGLRRLLTLDELQAVVAHELAHIANRDALVMSVVALPGSVMMNVRGSAAIAAALPALLGHTGALALSRYRELAADAGAAAITGRPSALASALLKVSDSLHQMPKKDLRAAAALNAFNLVPVDRRRHWWHRVALIARIAASHPPLKARLDALHALEAAQNRPYA